MAKSALYTRCFGYTSSSHPHLKWNLIIVYDLWFTSLNWVNINFSLSFLIQSRYSGSYKSLLTWGQDTQSMCYLCHHPIDWLLGEKSWLQLKEALFVRALWGPGDRRGWELWGLAMAARQGLVFKACPTIPARSSHGQPQPQTLAPLWWWGCAGSLQVALAQWGPWLVRAGLWGAGIRPSCSLTGTGSYSPGADLGPWAISTFGDLWVLMFWYHL